MVDTTPIPSMPSWAHTQPPLKDCGFSPPHCCAPWRFLCQFHLSSGRVMAACQPPLALHGLQAGRCPHHSVPGLSSRMGRWSAPSCPALSWPAPEKSGGWALGSAASPARSPHPRQVSWPRAAPTQGRAWMLGREAELHLLRLLVCVFVCVCMNVSLFCVVCLSVCLYKFVCV